MSQNASFSVGGVVADASFGGLNSGSSFNYSNGGSYGGGEASYGASSAEVSFGGNSGGAVVSSGGNVEVSRLLPAELANVQGYGQFETVQSLSNMSAGVVDRQLLEHENPNQCTDLAPALPLDQYRLNMDQNPHIIRKKAQEKLQYLQEISVRYLKPPNAPKNGDIIIKQLVNIETLLDSF